MSTIAVTGGAGFVGTNLVRALLSEKFNVIVIDDFSTGLRSNVEGRRELMCDFPPRPSNCLELMGR